MWQRLKDVLGLLEKRDRRRLFMLALAVVAMALIEVFGIASVMPFLGVVAKPELIFQSSTLHAIYEGLGFQVLGLHGTRAFMFAMGAGCLTILTLGNGFTAFTTWRLLRFAWLQAHKLSLKLLRRYLYEDYSFFLARSSPELATMVNSEVQGLVSRLLIPCVEMFARAVVSVCIMGLVVAQNWRLALVMAVVLGGAYGLIWGALRRKLKRSGQLCTLSNRRRMKATLEAFWAVKHIKLHGSEEVFTDRYSVESRNTSVTLAAIAIVGALPRYAMELVAFGGLFLILLILIASGQNLVDIVPLLGLYAFAGFKLMPSLQSIFRAFAQAQFSVPSLAAIQQDMRGGPPPRSKTPAPSLAFERSLELDGIRFRYPSGDSDVLRGLNLEIGANTTVGFVGSTGSGKTTSVDLILGLLQPQEGVMRVDGVELRGPYLSAWQQKLGYVPQEIFISDDTVAHNIAFGVPFDAIDQTSVENAARLARIHEFVVSELSQGYETVLGERGVRLSGGQRQRIGIARALYRNPEVLVLDEATSSLDGITEEAIMDAIHSLSHQKTIIMIAHRLSTVQACDRIFLLEDGKVGASGTYQELLRENSTFREMARVGEL